MKSSILKILFAAFLLSFFTHCQTKQKGSHAKIVTVNGNEVIDCNINEVTDTINLPLSYLIESCEMIPLETNEESLFESVYHIGISENFIAIHSYGQHPIKLFNRKGNFVRNIGSVGRGPGEFTSLYGIQLDENADRIYLTPFANAQEIITYNLDGENLPAIPLVFKQTKCRVYIENGTATVLSMPFNDQIPVAYQQTIDGKLIQQLPVIDYLILRPDFSNEISSSHNTGAYDLFIYGWGQEGFDTLYYYNTDKNKLIPRYVASFVDPKSNGWNYELKNHYYTLAMGEKYNNARIIVDKKTLKSDFFNIENDFYGNIPMYRFFMSTEGWFVASTHAYELISLFEEAIKNGNLNEKERSRLESLKNDLNENDNDVLFIGKMI